MKTDLKQSKYNILNRKKVIIIRIIIIKKIIKVKAIVPKYFLVVKNIYFLINPPYNYYQIHMYHKMVLAIFSIFTGNIESNI